MNCVYSIQAVCIHCLHIHVHYFTGDPDIVLDEIRQLGEKGITIPGSSHSDNVHI